MHASDLEKIALATTKDTSGDGVVDQWGMNYAGGWEDVIRFFAFSNGATLAQPNERGEYIFNFDSSAAIEALNFANKLLEIGPGEYGVMAREGERTYGLVDGNVALSTHNWIGGYRFNKQNLEDEWGLVPLPKGPSAERHYFPCFIYEVAVLPINVDDPEGLIALNEFLVRPWNEERLEEESMHLLELAIDRQQQWNVFMQATQKWQGEGEVFRNTPLWGILSEPITRAVEGAESPAAVMQEIRPEAQAFLDDLFNQ